MATAAATETPELVAFYRQAFSDFGMRTLWDMRASEAPTPEGASVVARALRIEGNLQAIFLAERIEQVCRADH